ncbi:MAG TPA: hypothetical protein VF175_05185 [Lacipirellula sp.]
MRALRISQFVAIAAAFMLLTMALINRGNLGMKGMPVPADSIVVCVIASAVAAYVATRGWHWLPAPFIAGIVGVFAGGRLGPTGGVLGFRVGLAVAFVVVAESRLTKRCR